MRFDSPDSTYLIIEWLYIKFITKMYHKNERQEKESILDHRTESPNSRNINWFTTLCCLHLRCCNALMQCCNIDVTEIQYEFWARVIVVLTNKCKFIMIQRRLILYIRDIAALFRGEFINSRVWIIHVPVCI